MSGINSHSRLRERVEDFLWNTGMHPDAVSLDACLVQYVDDMLRGLRGEPSSLAMLPAYVSGGAAFGTEGEAVAVDMGGTNLRVARVLRGRGGEIAVQELHKYRMPGTNGRITRNEFFDTLAEYIRPVIRGIRRIGVSFAYETRILPGLDGEIVSLAKEVAIEGIEGTRLGEGLQKALAQRGLDSIGVAVTSDPVAAAVSGEAQYNPEGRYCGYIGLIHGTGTNTAYCEKLYNIAALDNAPGCAGMYVNVESCNYQNLPKGTADIALAKHSGDPCATIEKMTSGAYLGSLFYFLVQDAVNAGLLSKTFAGFFSKQTIFSTIEMSLFTERCGATTACSESERTMVAVLCELLIKRAAKLIALEVAGAAVMTAKGDGSLCIVAEGTTFYKLPGLKAHVEAILEQWLGKELGIHTELVHIENAVLKGAGTISLMK